MGSTRCTPTIPSTLLEGGVGVGLVVGTFVLVVLVVVGSESRRKMAKFSAPGRFSGRSPESQASAWSIVLRTPRELDR